MHPGKAKLPTWETPKTQQALFYNRRKLLYITSPKQMNSLSPRAANLEGGEVFRSKSLPD